MFTIERAECVQVGYRTDTGKRGAGRKLTQWIVTQPDGYQRCFDTKRDAERWIAEQEGGVS